MTSCSVHVLDDELPADEAFVRLPCISAGGLKPAVGPDAFVAAPLTNEIADVAPPPIADVRSVNDHDPDTAEDDEDIDFAFDSSERAHRPATPWLHRLVGATAAAWGLSVLAHAAIIAVAVVALQYAGVTRPASIDFAYGDGRPEVGLKHRQGTPDRPPGWEGLASVLPPAATAATTTPPIERPVEADAVQEEMPADAPPPVIVETPPPPDETRVTTESAVQSPLPKFASTLKLREPPPEIPPDQETPAAQARASNSSESPSTPTTESANGSAAASPAAGDASPQNNASNPVQAAQSGGDGAAGDQGGAATGAGGTAATGDPGIPAGLRDGQNLPTPVYPEVCRRRGEQGEVRLQIEVLADGSVGGIHVETDAGFPRLAEAAIASLRGYTFRPALQDGQAVRSILVVPFRFNLR